MTTPADPERNEPSEGVDLSKPDAARDPADEPGFDPYRFGKPEHPIPAEYAPPGYTGPVLPTPPPPTPGSGTPPPGTNPANPFSNPPNTPYQPYGEQPGGYPPGAPPSAQQYPPSGAPTGQYQAGPYPPAQYPAGPYPPAQFPPGQYPPGPYAPGPYPPGPYSYAPQPSGGNGKAVTALVLGIGSIVFFWFSFFDAVLVIPGVIFGLIAVSEAKARGGNGRGMAVAGLICSIVGGVLAAIFTALLIHAADQCGGLDNSDAPGWDTCVRDNFF